MDNAPNPPSQPSSPAPTPIYPVVVAPTSEAAVASSKRQEMYEYAMLLFGGLTIASFFVWNGFMLKVSLGIFLVIAVVSIVTGLNNSGRLVKQPPVPSQNSLPSSSSPAVQKSSTPILKILGYTLLAIIALPILSYGVMILFIIILLIFGGGSFRMGS